MERIELFGLHEVHALHTDDYSPTATAECGGAPHDGLSVDDSDDGCLCGVDPLLLSEYTPDPRHSSPSANCCAIM